MNIAYFTNMYEPFVSGVATSIRLFKDELEDNGHTVFVFAPSYPNQPETDGSIIRLNSLPTFFPRGFYIPVQLTHLIKKQFDKLDIDLVHVHQPLLLGQAGLKLALLNNLPLVFTYHTLYDEFLHYLPISRHISGQIIRKLIDSFCEQCSLVIAPSHYVKDKIISNLPSANVTVIPTGVNFDQMKKVRKGRIRKKYSLSEKTKMLLYVGRLSKEKNVDFLIKAGHDIIKEEPDTIFFIIGDGDKKEALKRLVHECGLDDKIIFTGGLDQNQVYSFYADADLFLFASCSETQGIVLLEAQAFSLPIVALDSTSVSEYVIHGKNGFLANKDNFACSAIKLIRNCSLRSRFSMHAYQASKKYSIKKMSKDLIKEYTKIVRIKNTKKYNPFRRLKVISGID